jgi:tripeptidyl-peptidase-1
VGFFNPRLYQIASEHPEAFNDVVIGDNKCGIYGVDCCPYGFEAHAGWDPITGLGTPRYYSSSSS